MLLDGIGALLQLVASILFVSAPETRLQLKKEGMKSEYDYVIVGGGSAGAVVAARLSEDPGSQVLLMEAGGTESLVSDVPYAAPFLQMTAVDWHYETEPQKNACFGLKERRSVWPRGKVLGGTSVINYMLYVRGNARDYDLWAESGARGWSWREVLPYFLKSENMTERRLLRGDGYHSDEGPLTVSVRPDPSPLGGAFHEAGRHLGYTNDDYNGPVQSGFSIPQGTTRRGSRCSTARAFLEPAAGNRNLDILIHAHATKILFNEEKRAVGVEFEKNGVRRQVRARKEVVVSGGVINSAQLLMLSGVGPRAHLEELGVPLVADLPVGRNLHEHPVVGGLHFTVKKGASPQASVFGPRSVLQYLRHGRGPLTELASVEGLGWVKTKYANQTDDWPDIEFILMDGSPTTDHGVVYRRAVGMTDQLWHKVFAPYLHRDSFTLLTTLMRPKSRGYVKLRSADPHDKPIIDPNFLSDERDLLTLVEGMKIGFAVGLSPAYRKFDSKLFETVYPGCEQHRMWSDDYLACVARTFITGVWHPVGTCRMGDPKDATSVVDPELRVIGVHGLRVIDASVIPYLISGHTNAPSIMIGEKGADLIKGKQLPPVDLPPATSLKADLRKQRRAQEEVMEKLLGSDLGAEGKHSVLAKETAEKVATI